MFFVIPVVTLCDLHHQFDIKVTRNEGSSPPTFESICVKLPEHVIPHDKLKLWMFALDVPEDFNNVSKEQPRYSPVVHLHLTFAVLTDSQVKNLRTLK